MRAHHPAFASNSDQVLSKLKGTTKVSELQLLLQPSQREEGASMVEYALLVVLIAVVAIVAVNLIGPAVSEGFSEAGSGLAN